jgi:hypothetical protein
MQEEREKTRLPSWFCYVSVRFPTALFARQLRLEYDRSEKETQCVQLKGLASPLEDATH